MSFVMFGNFSKYCGWQMKVIEICQKFHEKYERYPNFIRMKGKTVDALFDEAEKSFLDPYSEEHALRDSNGNLLIPLSAGDDNDYEYPDDDDSWMEYGDSLDETEDFDDEALIPDQDADDENPEDEFLRDEIYPVYFGVNDDGTVSFETNEFELKFLEGEDLPEDCFEVQFGDGPYDGGEDYEEESSESIGQTKQIAA